MKLKYSLIAVLSLILLNICYSQETKISKKIIQEQNLDNLETKLNDSIAVLNNKIRNLSLDIKSEETQLKSDINDASQTIGYLNSLVNSFGQIFTILGIFIAVITLILPVLTYQFGIKPYKRALKDLEQGMDRRLENYLKNSRNNEIDKALGNIKEGNSELKNQAISYLALTQHEGFSEAQMFQIYTILNKHRDEYNIKSQLAFILSTRRNDYANQLFNSKDVSEDQVIKQMAYLYYAKVGYKDNYEGIFHILKSSDSQESEFATLAYNLMQYTNGEVLKLFNDKKIIDYLNAKSLKKLGNQIETTIQSLNLDNADYNSCYLAEKIKSALQNV